MKKLRIYGTLGPACEDAEILKQMLQEGMDGVRLNLSHTTLAEASARIEAYHSAANACGHRPELLIDLRVRSCASGRLPRRFPCRMEKSSAWKPFRFPLRSGMCWKPAQPGRRFCSTTESFCCKRTPSPRTRPSGSA